MACSARTFSSCEEAAEAIIRYWRDEPVSDITSAYGINPWRLYLALDGVEHPAAYEMALAKIDEEESALAKEVRSGICHPRRSHVNDNKSQLTLFA